MIDDNIKAENDRLRARIEALEEARIEGRFVTIEGRLDDLSGRVGVLEGGRSSPSSSSSSAPPGTLTLTARVPFDIKRAAVWIGTGGLLALIIKLIDRIIG